MKVQLKYFASMRESCGKTEEVLETEAQTIDEIFKEVKEKYSLPIEKDILKVALNESYVPFESSFKEMDTIVFIPPVAGG